MASFGKPEQISTFCSDKIASRISVPVYRY